MTVEQLLKPRYKVIAEWPGSEVAVGMICYRHYAQWVFPNGVVSDIHLESYPHLFRKLAWWEDREEKDMPKYVKSKSEINPTVQRLARFDLESDNKWRMFLHHSIAGYNPYDYLPATEQEYNDYINQFKEK